MTYPPIVPIPPVVLHQSGSHDRPPGQMHPLEKIMGVSLTLALLLMVFSLFKDIERWTEKLVVVFLSIPILIIFFGILFS